METGIEHDCNKDAPLKTGAKETVKPPLWTASFILICLSAFTTFVAFHSLIPTLPIYIPRHGGSTVMAGLALGSLTVAAVLSRPVTGWALDTYGRRLIYLAGLVLFLIPSVIYTAMIPALTLIALRFVQGIGWGVCNTASGTIASDVVPAQRLGEGMGFFSLAASFSLAISPGIGLWIMERYSFPVLFLFCSALIIISVLLALPIKYPKVKKPEKAIPFAFMEKAALRPAVVILFVTFTYSSLLSFLALFVIEQGLDNAGVFFLTLALTTVITRPLSGLIVDRRGRSGYDFSIILGTIATLIAMPVLAQAITTAYLITGAIFYGIGFGFIQPTMFALCISKVPPERRGGANATYWTAFDIGVAAGSIAWGLVAEVLGYSIMFNLTVIPVIIAAVIYFFPDQKSPPPLTNNKIQTATKADNVYQ